MLTCHLLQSYSLASLTAREKRQLPHDDLAPLKHMITDLSKQKLNRQRSQ